MGELSNRQVLHDVWRWWAHRLRDMGADQLQRPVRCAGWTVHHLAAHAAPDPDQLATLLTAVLDDPAAVTDGASLLRTFNAPGGVAHTMADDVAGAATAAAAQLPIAEITRQFDASADFVRAQSLDPDAVVPYPVVGSLTVAALTDVAIVEGAVHGLDLVAAIGGAPPPDSALNRALEVVVRVADTASMIDACTGRADPASVLPVLR